MKTNKIFAILSIAFLLLAPTAFAASEEDSFSLFGINFSKVWDFIAFWEDEKQNKDNNTSTQTNTNSQSTTNSKPVDFNITLGSNTYKKSELMSAMNNNEEINGYIKGFNYECMAMETSGGEKVTFYFNTDTGKVKNIRKTLDCEKQITIEDSLIDDISKDGFEGKKIKSYLERVDLPTSMYFKAIKVFTVG